MIKGNAPEASKNQELNIDKYNSVDNKSIGNEFVYIFDSYPGCYGEYDSFFVSRCHVCRYRLPCARASLRGD